jgi:hypothetical protein
MILPNGDDEISSNPDVVAIAGFFTTTSASHCACVLSIY